MSKKVIVILAEGFEEIEAVTIIDILKRAEIDIIVAGLNSTKITGSHGITIEADKKLSEIETDLDACILPGGMPGASNLAASDNVSSLIQVMNQNNKIIAAICASPAVVLSPLGILDQKQATCYPAYKDKFSSNVTFSENNVVVDNNIITGKSAGAALEFSLKIIEVLEGKELRDKIATSV